MLKILRNKNVSKLVLWGILILILPAFVIWGTGADNDSKNGKPKFIGHVNNRKVSFDDFASNLLSIRGQIIMNYFDQPAILDALLKSQPFLGKLAWDRLLMASEAKKAHIKVSNDEIVTFIRRHPAFSRGGVFDDRMYAYILKNNLGLEPRAFEEMMRSNLELQKFNNQLTKDIKVSDEEVLKEYRIKNDKIKISYMSFQSGDFTDKVNVEEKSIRDYYEAHRNEFALPDNADASGKAAGTIAALDDVKADIRALLAKKPAREAAIESARQQDDKVKDLMEKDGLGFAAAVERLGLKTRESALFSKGESIDGINDTVPVTEIAVKLKAGEVSGPVETRDGAVIFIVTGTQAFDEEKFKKERDDYAKRVLELKKNQYLENWLRGLENANKLNIDLNDYEKYYR